MKTNIVIYVSPPVSYLAEFDSRVIGQNVVGQSNSRIHLNVIVHYQYKSQYVGKLKMV